MPIYIVLSSLLSVAFCVIYRGAAATNFKFPGSTGAASVDDDDEADDTADLYE